ncbi:MAG: hypothetical protein LH629_13515, partial [Ignavibacteria bacterium]|nr:hypothetical protein [Ignavibacteria bacterium]
LQHHQINKLKWDNAINESLTPFPYLYAWYLDIAAPGWLAIADENYYNIMPLAVRKKAGIKYLYQPFFTQQFGLIQKINNSELLAEAIQLIKENFSYAELQFNYKNKVENGSSQQQRQTHHLLLNQSFEIIQSSYNTNLKRKLRKNAAYNFSETDNAKILIDVFRKMKGKEVSVLKQKDYDILNQLIQAAIKKQTGAIKMLYDGKEFLSGTFLLMNKYYIVNLFPVSSETGRINNGMSFLLDAIIKNESGNNKIFDFEGSDIKTVAQFYKSFGADMVPYQKVIINNLPWHSRIIKNIKDGLQSRR